SSGPASSAVTQGTVWGGARAATISASFDPKRLKRVVWLTPNLRAISPADTPAPRSRKQRRAATTICSSVTSFGLPIAIRAAGLDEPTADDIFLSRKKQ